MLHFSSRRPLLKLLGMYCTRVQFVEGNDYGRKGYQVSSGLRDHDYLRIDEHGEIIAAYPFSIRPTGHRVELHSIRKSHPLFTVLHHQNTTGTKRCSMIPLIGTPIKLLAYYEE